MSAPRIAPRHVPTLTEVIRVATPPVVAAPGQEQLVERILQRVVPDLDGLMGAHMQRLMREQASLLSPLLHRMIEDSVRQAVQQALAEEMPPKT